MEKQGLKYKLEIRVMGNTTASEWVSSILCTPGTVVGHRGCSGKFHSQSLTLQHATQTPSVGHKISLVCLNPHLSIVVCDRISNLQENHKYKNIPVLHPGLPMVYILSPTLSVCVYVN